MVNSQIGLNSISSRNKSVHSESSTRGHLDIISMFPKKAHPMDTIRTAVSYLGTTEIAWGGEPLEKDLERAIALLAKIPTMIATDFRLRQGKQFPLALT